MAAPAPARRALAPTARGPIGRAQGKRLDGGNAPKIGRENDAAVGRAFQKVRGFTTVQRRLGAVMAFAAHHQHARPRHGGGSGT